MTRQRSDYPLDYGASTAEGGTDRMREMADTAADKLKGAGEQAQQTITRATEQVREYGERAQDAARQFKPLVEKSLKERPMTTLAGAAAIGFILGALWKK